MPGKVILAGGNEMRPGCEEMDERVLLAAGGKDAHVVFLPTAVARYDPVGSGRGAMSYWGRLGASCEVAMILKRTDADKQEWTKMIEKADLVYLGGGDPDVLLNALAGSASWEAALRVYERGGVVGGSSAGAMVVCAQTLLPGKRANATRPWAEGLGLVPHALVLPHYSASRASDARALAVGLGATETHRSTVLGIAEMSGVLGDGDDWEAVGPSSVAVFQGEDARTYARDTSFTLDATGT